MVVTIEGYKAIKASSLLKGMGSSYSLIAVMIYIEIPFEKIIRPS